jgi:hypothetical protein
MDVNTQGADKSLAWPSATSAGKVLASIFGDQDGILLIDYRPKRQTIKRSIIMSAGLVDLACFLRGMAKDLSASW